MSDPIEWKFIQSFGDDNSSDDDLVTAVEFDATGDYLAVGDKAGRICIFQENAHASAGKTPSSASSASISRTTSPAGSSSATSLTAPVEYKFYTEFQSHEPEFDCLKSLEIEEKINAIKWFPSSARGIFLLATNDKTVKFWKVHERRMKKSANPRQSVAGQFVRTGSDSGEVVIPKLVSSQSLTTATPKRVFANAHGYHINSIAINSDCETFLSADDLRINLWNLNNSNEAFNLVDIKPSNLEELTEVITAATFHPSHCELMCWASSRGSMRLIDLRDSSVNHSDSGSARLFECDEDPLHKSFFSEIIASISDLQFLDNDGRYLLSRDYLTLKLWDLHMESKPLKVFPVHDFLKAHLCDLYENDCIFDKFECSASSDGKRIVSGSYNNHFVVQNIALEPSAAVTIEALKDGPKPRPQPKGKAPLMKKGALTGNRQSTDPVPESPNVNLMDFGKKALHVSYHPNQEILAIAGLNKLYVYQAFAAQTSTGDGASGRR